MCVPPSLTVSPR